MMCHKEDVRLSLPETCIMEPSAKKEEEKTEPTSLENIFSKVYPIWQITVFNSGENQASLFENGGLSELWAFANLYFVWSSLRKIKIPIPSPKFSSNTPKKEKKIELWHISLCLRWADRKI